MESETIDNVTVIDGDSCDSFVLRQEVVIPVIHLIIIVYKWIVTPCSILEYHVERIITIVFKCNHWIVR